MSSPEKKAPRLYSRRGDLGETSLIYGPRVGKDHVRIVALGTIDELSSWLGVVRQNDLEPELENVLLRLQCRLFDLGEEVASMDPYRVDGKKMTSDDVKALEATIDRWQAKTPYFRGFVISTGARSAVDLHMARTVCRRLERRLTALLRFDPSFSPRALAWCNRVGDLLFLLARYENERLKYDDSLEHALEKLHDNDLDVF
ncbi:MAG: cob(I)yrinic acid a,c-diamide adenosyltransferase [Planctomycetia bacterium]|nr:cob(I)yrinic acid a,c-diamide adenosyltransferase [Planctomycetia bacterium]